MSGRRRRPRVDAGARAPRPGSGASRLTSGARLVAVVSGLLTVALLFAPWGRSGTVDRTSLELLTTAGSVRVVTGGLRWCALSAWWSVTLVVAVSTAVRVFGRPRVADRLLALLVAGVGPLVVGVIASGAVRVRWGLWAALAAAMTAGLAGSVASWASRPGPGATSDGG